MSVVKSVTERPEVTAESLATPSVWPVRDARGIRGEAGLRPGGLGHWDET
ncbi:hypothetical protein AB0L13_31305 [Saccharopolyspora shandongensis]